MTDLATPSRLDEKRYHRCLKFFLLVIGLFMLVLCIAVALDNRRGRIVLDKSHRIKVGDQKSEVLETLGPPNAVFSAGPDWFPIGPVSGKQNIRPECWVYGRRLNNLGDMFSAEYPWVIPFRFRLGAGEDDVEIQFTDSERVQQVRAIGCTIRVTH